MFDTLIPCGTCALCSHSKPILIQDYTDKEFLIILKDTVAKLVSNSTLSIHISSNEMQVSIFCDAV